MKTYKVISKSLLFVVLMTSIQGCYTQLIVKGNYSSETTIIEVTNINEIHYPDIILLPPIYLPRPVQEVVIQKTEDEGNGRKKRKSTEDNLRNNDGGRPSQSGGRR
ncbi:MAG: hypothetical protein KKD86_00365 [Bacteroidetes bacterium]|nr:hypothetical protein [Bacteroidota bacterium]